MFIKTKHIEFAAHLRGIYKDISLTIITEYHGFKIHIYERNCEKKMFEKKK